MSRLPCVFRSFDLCVRERVSERVCMCVCVWVGDVCVWTSMCACERARVDIIYCGIVFATRSCITYQAYLITVQITPVHTSVWEGGRVCARARASVQMINFGLIFALACKVISRHACVAQAVFVCICVSVSAWVREFTCTNLFRASFSYLCLRFCVSLACTLPCCTAQIVSCSVQHAANVS